MKKTVFLILFLVAALACLPVASAQTYLYHAVVTESGSGSLTGTVPISGTVYLKMILGLTGLTPPGMGADYAKLSISDFDETNFAAVFIYSDSIILNFGNNTDSSDYTYETTVNGNESILVQFSGDQVVLTVDNVEVYNGVNAYSWDVEMAYYTVGNSATGSFETWVSLTDPSPTPTPTPTATPTAAPTVTPWVHNTAIPIGGNIGGLNTIILLLLLGGVGLSVTLLIVSKLKSNIIEAIIIMMILGTAGIVALLWLIGGFA